MANAQTWYPSTYDDYVYIRSLKHDNSILYKNVLKYSSSQGLSTNKKSKESFMKNAINFLNLNIENERRIELAALKLLMEELPENERVDINKLSSLDIQYYINRISQSREQLRNTLWIESKRIKDIGDRVLGRPDSRLAAKSPLRRLINNNSLHSRAGSMENVSGRIADRAIKLILDDTNTEKILFSPTALYGLGVALKTSLTDELREELTRINEMGLSPTEKSKVINDLIEYELENSPVIMAFRQILVDKKANTGLMNRLSDLVTNYGIKEEINRAVTAQERLKFIETSFGRNVRKAAKNLNKTDREHFYDVAINFKTQSMSEKGINNGMMGEITSYIVNYLEGRNPISIGKLGSKIDMIVTIGGEGAQTTFADIAEKELQNLHQQSNIDFLKNAKIISDAYNKIAQKIPINEDIVVIHENIKSYMTIGGQNYRGLEGASDWRLGDFLNTIEAINSNAGIFSPDQMKWLRFILLNANGHTVSYQKTDRVRGLLNPIEDFLGIFAINMLFEDGPTMAINYAQKAISQTNSLKTLHVFRVNNLLYPTSLLLERLRDNLINLKKFSTRDVAKVSIAANGGNLFALAKSVRVNGVTTQSSWEAVRAHQYDKVSLTIVFLKDIMSFFQDLQKYILPD